MPFARRKSGFKTSGRRRTVRRGSRRRVSGRRLVRRRGRRVLRRGSRFPRPRRTYARGRGAYSVGASGGSTYMSQGVPLLINKGRGEGSIKFTKRELLFQMRSQPELAKTYEGGSCYITNLAIGGTIKDETGTYTHARISLNPGLQRLCPWGHNIVNKFEMYRLNSIMFTFESLTNADYAKGEVLMAHQENSFQATNIDAVNEFKITALNQSARPDKTFSCGVECNKSISMHNWKYVRSAPLQTDSAQRIDEFDYGTFFINSSATTPNGGGGDVVIGNVWVSYEVEMQRPVLHLNRNAQTTAGYDSKHQTVAPKTQASDPGSKQSRYGETQEYKPSFTDDPQAKQNYIDFSPNRFELHCPGVRWSATGNAENYVLGLTSGFPSQQIYPNFALVPTDETFKQKCTLIEDSLDIAVISEPTTLEPLSSLDSTRFYFSTTPANGAIFRITIMLNGGITKKENPALAAQIAMRIDTQLAEGMFLNKFKMYNWRKPLDGESINGETQDNWQSCANSSDEYQWANYTGPVFVGSTNIILHKYFIYDATHTNVPSYTPTDGSAPFIELRHGGPQKMFIASSETSTINPVINTTVDVTAVSTDAVKYHWNFVHRRIIIEQIGDNNHPGRYNNLAGTNPKRILDSLPSKYEFRHVHSEYS